MFTFISIGLYAQIVFQKAYGGTGMDNGHSVCQTIDGGYIIAGTTTSFGSGGRDVYVVKTDASGDTLWTKTFGGAMDNEYGFCVQQTSDSGYVISGVASSFDDVAGDIYLIKLNASGDTNWTRTYGGIGVEWGNSVQQTTDGGYIMAGQTPAFGAGGFDAYLVKTDASGNISWTKTIGSPGLEIAYAIQQTADGGYIVTGQVDSDGAGFGDFYLIKTNHLGDVEWTKAYGVSGEESGVSVRQTTDGGYIIGGSSEDTGTLGKDMCLIKTNSTGNILWANTYGGDFIDECYDVIQTNDEGYIMCGKSFSFSSAGDYDVYIVKVNNQGAVLWSKTFGASGSGSQNEIGYSIQQTQDGGFIIAGESLMGFGVGLMNVYLIKTDSFGNSGCNQGNPATATSIYSPQVFDPTTLTSTGGNVSFPATIVNAGTTQTNLCGTFTSLDADISENSIQIYPNPVCGNASITIHSKSTNLSIKLYNSIGQMVYSSPAYSPTSGTNTISLDLSDLKQGIHFCRVESELNIQTIKLIKQ